MSFCEPSQASSRALIQNQMRHRFAQPWSPLANRGNGGTGKRRRNVQHVLGNSAPILARPWTTHRGDVDAFCFCINSWRRGRSQQRREALHQTICGRFVGAQQRRRTRTTIQPRFLRSMSSTRRAGGGGAAEFNVSLLSAQLDPNSSRPSRRLLVITLRSLHPAFVGEGDRIVPNILLHRFGPGERYFQFKAALGGQQVPLDPFPNERDQLQAELTREPLPVLKKGPIRLVRAQRNTTALFGSGLIDQIPDRTLHDLAKLQTTLGKVSGRVPPIGPDRVGRFGWRGQQERLHDFVLGACANELGLEVPGTPQPLNPLQPKYRPDGLDLSAEQCTSLTAFVAALPAPREIELSIHLQDSRNHGKVLFASLGCADCHVEQVGEVAGIYSDLLLHDMGPKLADPVMAEASLTYIRRLPDDQRSQPEPQPPATYYGGSSFQDLAVTGPRPSLVEAKDQYGIRNLYSVEKTNFESEWRTPPLWGVADSAPYLHDGRAPTLVEAILWHGGEADSAVDQFKRLELADRLHLLTFLRSLRAP